MTRMVNHVIGMSIFLMLVIGYPIIVGLYSTQDEMVDPFILFCLQISAIVSVVIGIAWIIAAAHHKLS